MLVRSFSALFLSLVLASGACSADPAIAERKSVERGDQYLAEKKYSEALIEYSRALQRNPQSSTAYEHLGRLHLETGNQAGAWQAYQKAAEMAPQDVNLQIQAGGVLLLAHRFDDARRLAERVLAVQPNSVEGLVLQANALVGLENLDTAVTLVQQAIDMGTGQGELYSNLGSLQATSGQLERAEATYKRAIEVAPERASSYLPLGNFYWATGRSSLAEESFQKAVTLEPSNILAHRALATFYLGAGMPMRAEAPLRYVAEHSGDLEHRMALGDYYLATNRAEAGAAILNEVAGTPEGEARAKTRLAAYTYASGRRDEARRSLDELLTKYPNEAAALLLKGKFLNAQGKHEEAIQFAAQASRVQAGFIRALYFLGQLHAENGDLFQATEAYKKILEVNPRATRAQVELSRLLYVGGSADTSTEVLNRVVNNLRADSTVQLSVVRALLERRDLKGAEAQLKPLLAQYPEAAPVRSLLGTLAALKQDYPASRRWYLEALKSNPNAFDAISGLVGLDLIAGRFPDAQARAEAAAKAWPDDGETLLLLAKTYGATQQLPKAQQVLRHAIEVNPDGIDAYGMLGQLLYQNGSLADARAEFERMVQLRPRSVPAQTMVAVIQRAEGKTEAAMASYRKVLALEPQAPVAANNLAWIYTELGVNLDEAVMLARVAKKKLPDAAAVTDTLGWAYYRNGAANMLSLALPLLEEVVAKEPSNPLFRYHLGAAYARGGRTVEARRELQEALKLSGDFRGASESRRLLASLQ